jgi:hypothetical protein
MKNLTLLAWLTQLGLSIAFPPACFIGIAAWLKNSQGWGSWVIWAGVILGFVGAIDGLRVSLKALERLSRDKKEKDPPVSFNDHS